MISKGQSGRVSLSPRKMTSSASLDPSIRWVRLGLIFVPGRDLERSLPYPEIFYSPPYALSFLSQFLRCKDSPGEGYGRSRRAHGDRSRPTDLRSGSTTL